MQPLPSSTGRKNLGERQIRKLARRLTLRELHMLTGISLRERRMLTGITLRELQVTMRHSQRFRQKKQKRRVESCRLRKATTGAAARRKKKPLRR
jgi:hypothetical protein